MGKKTKTGKSRLDTFYYLAKEQGYRSRAAFKLIQLNKKHAVLKGAKGVLDLCAAPGGWLQVIAGQVAVGATVIGVDRVPIAPIPRCQTVTADLKDCVPILKRMLGTQGVDVIVHDGAPNVGVAWKHDAYQQTELVLLALKICTVFLQKNGHFVTKVFRCKEYNYLLWVFHQLFHSVEATKPEASRKVSAEIYVVCKGYKKPETLDPKLLDPRHVFKEVEMKSTSDSSTSQSLISSVFKPGQARRHREGYADTKTGLLYKGLPLEKFIEESNSASLLASHHQMTIPKGEHAYAMWVTEDIAQLLSDLQVLGKREYKKLLKWRLHVRLEAGIDKKPTEDTEVAEEEVLDIEALAERADRERQLRLKRELRKRKEKLGQTHLKLHEASSAMVPIDLAEAFHGQALDRDDTGAALFFDQPLFKEAQGLLDPEGRADIELGMVEEEEEDNDVRYEDDLNENEAYLEWSEEEEVEEVDPDTLSNHGDEALMDSMSAVDDHEMQDAEALSDVSMEDEALIPKSKTPLLTDAVSYSLAQARLRQSKNDLIDESFNRYSTLGQAEDLPSWFAADEQKYMRPRHTPSREAVVAVSEKSKSVDARSIRRVLEAKYRKKKRVQRQLEQRNAKAHRIMQTEGFNEAAKARAINTLYSKSLKKPSQNKRTVVVAKGGNKRNPGRPSGVKGRYKMVDKRMKKENRALKRIEKKKGTKSKKSKKSKKPAKPKS